MGEPLSDHDAQDAHEALLIKAAGIGQTHLICHMDTWNFIIEQCSIGQRSTHFNPPAADTLSVEERGMVTVPVSGRTLAAILDQMNEDSLSGALPTVTPAVATAVRDAILEALDSDDRLPVVIIDSHPYPDEPEEDEQE
ncbi:hypothetical protein [Streptomyces sp. NPDC097640]|uniref:hypothetical protein n=1 Tax=Streptomyces sp. NPDC097640 TaxID=3157229 RepID=UPI00332199C8